jgi:hypothetical protein
MRQPPGRREERAVRRLERWLFAPGSARRVAAVRIGLCSILAVRLSRGLYLGLAGQPAALFRPVSFMHALPSMPGRGPVLLIQAVGISAAVLATVGLRARLTLPAAWAAGVFLNGMATSIGKIVHNDVLLLLALFPLMAAPTSDVWSVDAWLARRAGAPGKPSEALSVRYGWAVRAAMVVVAGAYFFTGLGKVVFSGPAWATGDNLRWVLYAASDGRASPNGAALFIADNAWLAHLSAAGVLLFELSFPVVLFRPRWSWFFIVGAVALHAGIWFTLHLDYFAQAATVVVVLTDWPAVLAWARRRGRGRPEPAVARATG